MTQAHDSIVCHNEKLESGSTGAYVQSCRHFLDSSVFQDDTSVPTVILAPSNLVDSNNSPNFAIEVSERFRICVAGRTNV